MKYIVFTLETKKNIWVYENIQLQNIDNYEWALIIDKEYQIYESIYDAINELAKRGFSSTFRYTAEMENVNPINKCD